MHMYWKEEGGRLDVSFSGLLLDCKDNLGVNRA